MGRERQRAILEIISGGEVANQHELVGALREQGIGATQSSVSRDIARLGLIKLDGYYAVPGPEVLSAGPIVSIDTAGDCLVVIKTEIGQAAPQSGNQERALDTVASNPVADTQRKLTADR
jgi:transcriptional regulator of arginine metabolism